MVVHHNGTFDRQGMFKLPNSGPVCYNTRNIEY